MSADKTLTMWRKLLPPLPVHPPPTGIQIRQHLEEDVQTWTSIQQAADTLNEITDSLFHEAFGKSEKLHHQRILYIATTSGETFGTAAAWYGPDGPEHPLGRVHWVAIHPDFQGRGHGKPLVAATLALLMSLGHRECYLKTDKARTAALGLYKSLGFQER
ncbi:MAG: GNAT family N-acetyltransferase [Candidatus Sumerlaeia bacterium]|nr:GNAT family N-acetyltransferase [Candidatus Sumerlaeia bacterium]